MSRPLNIAMGWIVAVWLLAAALVELPWWLFCTLVGCAVLTVIVWVAIRLAIHRLAPEIEE